MYEHLVHYLVENASNDKGLIKFLDRKGVYTSYNYSEIYEQSKVYASYFLQNGVKKNDVVSIMLPTSYEFITSFLGSLLVGAVPACLYPPTGIAGLDEWAVKAIEMMDKANSNHIVSNLKISSLFGKKLHKNKKEVLLIEACPVKNTLFNLDIESYRSSDLCFLQFSSGTTGSPKPVMVTNENAIFNGIIMREGCSVEKEDVRTVNWAPLYHDMGLVGAFISTLVANGELTLIRPDDFLRKPKLWLKAISDTKATITAAPNFAFGLCTKRIQEGEIDSLDLSSLKIALCGAEVIYQKTMTDFYEKFKKTGLIDTAITPSFGIAEGTLGVTFCSSQDQLKFLTFDRKQLESGDAVESKSGITLCSLGKPLRGVGVSIKDSSHNNVSEGKIGEIFISGKSVSSGYYNDSVKTDETIINGELKTGDEGFIYKGELYICGRIKDTIIIRGKNYYPTVFEEKLCEVKPLREGRIAVSSMFDETENTEQLVVLAEVKNDSFLSDKDSILKEIQKVVGSMGQKAKAVELFAPNTLPKTTSGKLKRRTALEMWKNASLKQVETPSNFDLAILQFKYFLNYTKIRNNSRDKKYV